MVKASSPMKRGKHQVLILRYLWNQILYYLLCYIRAQGSVLLMLMCLDIHSGCFCLKDSASPEMQEQGAGSSKSKTKVKSVELPILTCTVRQLDRELLNNLEEEEVSSFQLCLIHWRQNCVEIALWLSYLDTFHKSKH